MLFHKWISKAAVEISAVENRFAFMSVWANFAHLDCWKGLSYSMNFNFSRSIKKFAVKTDYG